jgi:hypothetical protein
VRVNQPINTPHQLIALCNPLYTITLTEHVWGRDYKFHSGMKRVAFWVEPMPFSLSLEEVVHRLIHAGNPRSVNVAVHVNKVERQPSESTAEVKYVWYVKTFAAKLGLELPMY